LPRLIQKRQLKAELSRRIELRRIEAAKANSAAVILQSHWRRYTQRSKYLKTKMAAVTIQAAWRAHFCLTAYFGMKMATQLVQGRWRFVKHLRMKKQARQREVAAVKVQAWWKMTKDRRKFKMQKRGVLVLQAHLRGHLARQQLRRQQVAALRIQQYYKR
jgi:abnormal spindle-like microcephaly-associated protein